MSKNNKYNQVIMKNKKVVIWGIDDYNVLGLCRQFGNSEFDLTFVVYRGTTNCATSSKFCKKYIVAPTIEDGYNYLMTNFTNETEKVVLINSNDLLAEFIDEHKSEFERFFTITGTNKPGSIKEYNNKHTMGILAKEIGFKVPYTMVCKWDSNISNVIYPCILKPTHQTLGRYNEFKFKICRKASELKNTLNFVRHDSEFLLQEYIPKEKDILVYGARMKDGRVCLAGALVRDRFCGTGESSHGVVTANIPSCVNIQHIEKFLSIVDYYGLFSVEYGLYKEQAYFFEVNFRNDGTSHFFYQSGANIPLAWAYSSLGLDYTSIPTSVQGDHFYMDELYDIQNVKEGKISKSDWEKERAEVTIFKYYDKDDLVPYEMMKKIKRRRMIIGSLVSKYRIYIVWLMDKIGLKRK